MEQTFAAFAHVTASLIDFAAVLIVAFGCGEALIRLAGIVVRPGTSHGQRKVVWRRLGVWLVLGLEFELAADIIASVVSPTWLDIGQLGAIAVVRTFLNYFLEKDLEAAKEIQALEQADLSFPDQARRERPAASAQAAR